MSFCPCHAMQGTACEFLLSIG
uniref:Uncharacterized protein n=1 Tax=Rhizophora mucronata TaxID=61149 RepID=A0A2P2NMW9_RHIMU